MSVSIFGNDEIPPPKPPRRLVLSPLMTARQIPAVMEPKFRFIQTPHLSRDKTWEWPPLYVKESGGDKGLGVFASRRIEPGLVIPYVGALYRNTEEADRELRRRAGEGALGAADAYRAKTREYKPIVDAYPDSDACSNMYCVASYINEATSGKNEFYNCIFWNFPRSKLTHIPAYSQVSNGTQDFNSKACPFVVVCTTLEPHQELLMNYGDDVEDRGYTPKPFDGVYSSGNNDQFSRTVERLNELLFAEEITWAEE